MKTPTKVLCEEHPKYSGRRSPRTTCPTCHAGYHNLKQQKDAVVAKRSGAKRQKRLAGKGAVGDMDDRFFAGKLRDMSGRKVKTSNHQTNGQTNGHSNGSERKVLIEALELVLKVLKK